jgi:hypothetical protein
MDSVISMRSILSLLSLVRFASLWQSKQSELSTPHRRVGSKAQVRKMYSPIRAGQSFFFFIGFLLLMRLGIATEALSIG